MKSITSLLSPCDDLSDLKVLVVNDYMMMQKIVGNLFRHLGIPNVHTASSGPEALEKIKEEAYHVIISSWDMEAMSGLELAQHLKSALETAHIPLILMTADNKGDHIAKAKDAQVDGVLIKPFNAQGLHLKLKEVIVFNCTIRSTA